jgi:hypothetical protein
MNFSIETPYLSFPAMDWSTRALIPLLLGVLLIFRVFQWVSSARKGGHLSKDKGIAISLSISPLHKFSKDVVEEITLMKELGIKGDCQYVWLSLLKIFETRAMLNPP